jgi:hypothetical protein
MQTSLKKRAGLGILGLAGLASIISMGTASAQQRLRASDYYGYYNQNAGGAGNPYADGDENRFDRSGSRGREYLGASPYHPEGPGNPTD